MVDSYWEDLSNPLLVSTILSLLAITVGYFFERSEKEFVENFFNNYLSDFEKSKTFIRDQVHKNNIIAAILLVNFFLDYISVYVTIRVIKVIAKGKNFFSMIAIIVDSSFAIVCALLVVPLGKLMVALTGYPVIPTFAGEIEFVRNLIVSVFQFFSGNLPFESVNWSVVFFISTTLIPTLFYLSLVLILLISKYTLMFTKWVTGGFLLRAIDDEPHKLQVFTLTGTFLGVLGALAKVIQHFLSI